MANPPKLYVPVPAPVVDEQRHITRDWVLMFDQLIARVFATGTVVGPSTSGNNEIVLFNGTTGQILKAATGTGVVHATAGVYSTSDVTYAELPSASAASLLLGRGSAAGAGDWQELTVGTGVTIAATVAQAKPDDFILIGTRAAQPAASAVLAGTLYCLTDERNAVERSTGSAWAAYVRRRHAAIFPYDYSDVTTAPPTSNQVRINAAAPYTAATKVFIRYLSNDGRDVWSGLMGTDIGALIRIQDKNDHTIFASFTLTGVPVDQTTYVEWPVVYESNGGASLFNNQAVLVIKQ